MAALHTGRGDAVDTATGTPTMAERYTAEEKAALEVIEQAPSNPFDDAAAYFDFWIDKLDSDNLELKMYAVRQIEVHQDRPGLIWQLRARPNAVEKCKDAATFFWSDHFREGSPQSKVAGPLARILYEWGFDFPNSPWAKQLKPDAVLHDPSLKLATMHYPFLPSPDEIIAKHHPERPEAEPATIDVSDAPAPAAAPAAAPTKEDAAAFSDEDDLPF